MRNRNGLTSRQKECLDIIKTLIRENGYPPSQKEICIAMGQTAVRYHIDALERKGYIRRTLGTSRSIVITEVT